jgi:TRAP-type mannitol/chloroaromatic compound transport system substrate-binding protein
MAASAAATIETQAKYDHGNVAALKRLVGAGTKLRPFSPEVLEACWKAANEVYAEINAKNPKFKKVYESWRKFRDDELQWFAVGENTFDSFQVKNRAKMAPPATKGAPKAAK